MTRWHFFLPCPIPTEPHSYTKSHWLQPGAVAEEVVERWWSCNEDGVSPHSLPSLQRSEGLGARHLVWFTYINFCFITKGH